MRVFRTAIAGVLLCGCVCAQSASKLVLEDLSPESLAQVAAARRAHIEPVLAAAFEEVPSEYVPPAPRAEELKSPAVEAELALAVQQLELKPDEFQRIQGPGPDLKPLTPGGKFKLAMRNVLDPFTFVTAAGDSAVSTGFADSKSVYGTGWAGFGRRFGTDMTDEINGELFETYIFPSLLHQDPHYHRMPDASRSRRIAYALTRVFVARGDDGHAMPNYGELLGTFASASVSNAYHYDRDTGVGPTATRIGVSIGSDAAWNLFNEFWPDIAPKLHLKMVFLQRLAERAAQPN